MRNCTDTTRNKKAGGFIAFRRFEQQLRNVAGSRGLDGDPFAVWIPDCGTECEQLTIAELSADLRHRIPRGREDDAFRMIRAVVLTRNEDEREPAARHGAQADRHPAIQRQTAAAIGARVKTRRGARR